jgi:SAM-dependent methyltransferase
LFRAFLEEQSDPDRFYRLIARDAVDLVEEHVAVRGLTVADFGGGPGFYSEAFREAGARTVLVDADLDEIRLHGRRTPGSVVGLAERAPLADASVDLAFSSNLLEHVRDLGAVADQIVRVVRPGGVVVLSYTVWLGPWGGHETSPWHLLGGHRAARRYERKQGRRPKNRYGETMFPASVRDGLRWLRSRPDLEVLDLRPRYLPRWSRVLLRVPVLRELLTWNLWIVVRKRPE